jgi:hypothetical protein
MLLAADILRGAKDEDAAYAIERQLLAGRMLNLRRLPRMLDAIAAREGAAAARAAALDVADYSDHPAALRLAAEARLDAAARDPAAKDAARALLDRLAAVAPSDPALPALRARL